jgi:hypothetical protein
MSTDIDRSDAHDDPSDAELDATDGLLSSIATGTVATAGEAPDPVTELLRAASGPAGAGELVGADQFVAAVSSTDTEPRRAGTSPAALVGKAFAAKAAVIAAVTVLGIAGAGAATGVILRVANDSGPQPVVTVDDPDVASTTPDDSPDLGGLTRDPGSAGSNVDPARVRTCAAATDVPGLERLANAATAANSTAADYCRGTGTLADPDRPGTDARTDSSASADDRLATGGRRADPAVPPDRPARNDANGSGSGNGAATPGTPNTNTNANPKAGNGATNGNSNGPANGNSNGNGAATPGTPNTNANPKAGNGATNGNSNGPANGNRADNNGAATPGTPNTNANPKAGNGATNGAEAPAAGGSAAGARSVDRGTGGVRGNDTAPDTSKGGRGGARATVATPASTPPR